MAHSNGKNAFQIVRQTWITREDLKANPNAIYVFGDNVAREGQRGLARQMRNESNAHSISICWGPFEPFTKASAAEAMHHMREDLTALSARRPTLIVWPINGIVPDFMTFPDELHRFLRREVRERFGCNLQP